MNNQKSLEKKCNKHEIRDSYKKDCPEEQRKKCHGNIPAVDQISFHVNRGEIFGGYIGKDVHFRGIII